MASIEHKKRGLLKTFAVKTKFGRQNKLQNTKDALYKNKMPQFFTGLQDQKPR